MLLILLFIFQTNVYTRHYTFPFIPYPFYSIPFYYGLNASNTRASPFFSFFLLPPYFPSFLTPQHMVSTMQTKPNKPLYIVCPISFIFAFYRVFPFPLHFSTLAPFMHFLYFYVSIYSPIYTSFFFLGWIYQFLPTIFMHIFQN